MNLRKDVNDELTRDLYYKRIEFSQTLMNENISYSEKIARLISLAKEITLIASTFQTVNSLLGEKESEADETTQSNGTV